jgi:hypothetical protein
MSHCSAFEGTLLVNPLLQLATAYFLLRPFFTPKTGPSSRVSVNGALEHTDTDEYLSPDNWKLEDKSSSWLQGANLGRGQELNALLHPHLNLPETMVHIPKVQPGDYVVWHCDGIHAVDKIHAGKNDSSVLYIPACPLTERNAEYLVRQRDCFLRGMPKRAICTIKAILTKVTQALPRQTSPEVLAKANIAVARCKKISLQFRGSTVYAPWAWRSSMRTLGARQERKRSWQMQTGSLVSIEMAHGWCYASYITYIMTANLPRQSRRLERDLEACFFIERCDDPIAVIAITSLSRSPDDRTGWRSRWLALLLTGFDGDPRCAKRRSSLPTPLRLDLPAPLSCISASSRLE